MGLDNQGDLHYTDSNGFGGIHHAVQNGHTQLVKVLLTQDRDLLYLEVEDDLRNTPLHLIAASGNLSMMKVVAGYGPDFSTCNIKGETCLHTAAKQGDQKMSLFILGKSGNLLLEAQDKSGNTALDVSKDASLKLQFRSYADTSAIASDGRQRGNSEKQKFNPTNKLDGGANYNKALESVLKGP